MPTTLTCPHCSDEDRDLPAGVFWCSICTEVWFRAETIGDVMRTLIGFLDQGDLDAARRLAADVADAHFDQPLDPLAPSV